MENTFRVKKSEHGKTLQAFLHDKLATFSHKQIKNAIDKKCVFVNSKNVFISRWNLKSGDRVLFVGDKRADAVLQDQSRYHYVQVLHEDEDLLVTNKPPFIDYDSFVANVNAYIKRTHGKNFYPYVGQMHRLDKETSGVLIFTKKKRANILAEQFRNRAIKKYYLALVWGRVEREQGIIRAKLEKTHLESGKKVRVVEDDNQEGKESHTEYCVEERYENATLLRILLGTGRTHQIRVHMASIGHPIIGDKLYGGVQNLNPKSRIISRQALHAHRMEFFHPVTNKKIKITAPIPKDMEEAIDKLRMGTV